MQNLATFLKTHIVGMAVFAIVCSLVASALYSFLSGTAETPAQTTELVPQSSSTKPEKDEGSMQPALRVEFSDGSTALVELAYQTALNVDEAPRVMATYGDQKSALLDLHNSVKGALFAILESMSLADARKNREEVARLVIDASADAQKRTGHSIVSLSIHSIEAHPSESANKNLEATQ